MTLAVHSMETMGTLDGPGIRTVLFLQGCNLQCKYCHNRDMWEQKPPLHSHGELLREVLKYRTFYDASGGGVTVSGGEPLCQAHNLASFLRLCKKNRIHTALDTSGAVALTAPVREVLGATDLVLLDIKHIHSAQHRKITGAGNEKTRACAQYLEKNAIPFQVRYVVVPGYSDDAAGVRDLAGFLQDFSCLEEVWLLPYHTLGEHKWKSLGHAYELKGISAPSPDHMKYLQELMLESGLKKVFLRP
ncbi:MAG: pyruvate formate-lyase-activating protein [Fibrobacterota bacterium]